MHNDDPTAMFCKKNVYFLPSFEKSDINDIKNKSDFIVEINALLEKANKEEWTYTSYFLSKAIESVFSLDCK